MCIRDRRRVHGDVTDNLLDDFEIALKRIIIRGLDKSLDGNAKLADFLFHDEFWKPEKRTEARNISLSFPEDVLIKDVYYVYKEVLDFNNPENDQSVSDVASRSGSMSVVENRSVSSDEAW
eukprot:TRINITY_DN17168_c0_g1_i1.p2 TRINITY_DN17168_c0_g1~~TRINITY_DN17168_c0_g1_i1.p2  ORF type:complete len:121 (+),score=19.59 TRINITY_DN17168_c0_g1_i1:138-500(+)